MQRFLLQHNTNKKYLTIVNSQGGELTAQPNDALYFESKDIAEEVLNTPYKVDAKGIKQIFGKRGWVAFPFDFAIRYFFGKYPRHEFEILEYQYEPNEKKDAGN